MQKKTKIEVTSSRAFCDFCQEIVEVTGHVTECSCGGKLHNREERAVCATCGRVSEAQKDIPSGIVMKERETD